jgi:hypothetical protein
VYCHSAPPYDPILPLTPVNLSSQAPTHHHRRPRQHVARSLYPIPAATHHCAHHFAPIPVGLSPLDCPQDAVRNPAAPHTAPTNHAPRQHHHNPTHISPTTAIPVAIALAVSTSALPNARHNRASGATPMDTLQHTLHIVICAHLHLDTANTMAHRRLNRCVAAIIRDTE